MVGTASSIKLVFIYSIYKNEAPICMSDQLQGIYPQHDIGISEHVQIFSLSRFCHGNLKNTIPAFFFSVLLQLNWTAVDGGWEGGSKGRV